MTKNILTKAILAAVGVVLSATSASAQNTSYNQAGGDITLFAQKIGGTQTLLLNIGTGQGFRDTTSNLIDLKNIGTELAAISGQANWYDDADLFWGIAGVRSASDSNAAALFGDGARTIYTTKERTALGIVGSAQSNAWVVAGNTAMTNASSGIIQMTNRLETVGGPAPFASDRLVEAATASQVDNQNPFIGVSPNFNPGSAFGSPGNLPGGVMGRFGAGSFGTFGGESAESALDLYRILGSVTASGTVDVGTLRTGQYQGTFVIDQGGDVSFIVTDVVPVPEPATMVAGLALGAVATLTRRRRRGQTAATAA
jgi:hypothetical protein